MTERLLELDELDTALDRLARRRRDLPELVDLQHARDELIAWEAERRTMRERLDELERLVAEAEEAAAEIDRQRSRLEGQMKQVIAPREAEALQHEIATLQGRRDELDDRELEALEEQAALDDRLVAHVARETDLRVRAGVAEAALAAATADLDREQAELEQRRGPLRDEIDRGLLDRYDTVRSQLGGGAARLIGHRCDGCHLDLSPAEVDDIKTAPEGEVPPCPQCGRLLVR